MTTDDGISLGDRLADWGYAAGWKAVRELPEPVARRAFDLGADLAARRQTPDSQLRKNLSRVLGVSPAAVPEWLIRDSLRSYARYWREAFRLPTMDHRAILESMDELIRHRERLDEALGRGKGMILALPHQANWDLAGLWLTQRYGQFATVAERLKPESLYERFVAYRESLGFEVLPLTGGEVAPFVRMTEVLEGNGLICLMGERDLRRTGVEVDFFGEKTRMPAGAVKLAQETGATLMAVDLHYVGDSLLMDPSAPLDVSGTVAEGVQALADHFQDTIARHPADWHMLQPQWIADLDAGHRDYLEGRAPSARERGAG